MYGGRVHGRPSYRSRVQSVILSGYYNGNLARLYSVTTFSHIALNRYPEALFRAQRFQRRLASAPPGGVKTSGNAGQRHAHEDGDAEPQRE